MNRDEIIALPKAELHLHLEGAIPPRLAAELAECTSAPPPRGPFTNQAEFVAAYEGARDLIRSLDDLREVARAVGERQRALGIVWTEVHFMPLTYAGRLGSEDAMVEAVIDGLSAGAGADGAGVILGINRALGTAAARRSLDLALRWADRGVVALGLAGDEAKYPALPFAPVFAQATNAGMPCVPHAGEILNSDTVATALDQLHAHRISHGLAAATDPRLIHLLAASNVCLDMAPSSNVMLGLVSSLTEHPLPRLQAEGVPVTLSTDIPLFLGHDLAEEYARCQRAWSLPHDALRALAANSLTYALGPRPAPVSSTSRSPGHLAAAKPAPRG